MKQYKFLGGGSFQPISNGTSFVITTSMQAYSECEKGISIHFFCGSELYWLSTYPPDNFSTYSDTTGEFKNIKWTPKGSKEDVNFVVRVDKLTKGDNPAFTTYINGEYLTATKSRCPSTVGSNSIFIQPLGLPVTLTVFNDAEFGSIEEFVQEMRNSEVTYFDLNADGSEGATRADGGSSSIPGMEPRSQDAEVMGSFDLTGDGSEGVSNTYSIQDGLASAASTEVPDANAVNQSSTVAWKKVVNNVLGLSKRMGSAFSLKERTPQQYLRQGTDDGSDRATGTILNSDGGIQPTREL